MRTCFLFIVSALFISAVCVPESQRWVIDSNSRLVINGQTNVNRFTCKTDCYGNNDTLEYSVDTGSCTMVFSRNTILLPVNSFSCGSEMITNDFMEMLNLKKYPDMKIRFLSLDHFNHPVSTTRAAGNVKITLAGITKTYNVIFSVSPTGKESFLLTGKQTVCFSDFNLIAPRKMMGLIQVKEDLEVEFFLKLRSL